MRITAAEFDLLERARTASGNISAPLVSQSELWVAAKRLQLKGYMRLHKRGPTDMRLFITTEGRRALAEIEA